MRLSDVCIVVGSSLGSMLVTATTMDLLVPNSPAVFYAGLGGLFFGGLIAISDVVRWKKERVLQQKINNRDKLIYHVWLHSSYLNNGYAKMTTAEKELYDGIVERWKDTNLSKE